MKLSLTVLAVLLVALSVSADAIYTFDCISNTNETNAQVGEDQLSLTVSEYGSNQILFNLNNSGPQQAVITKIFLDDKDPLDLVFNSFVYASGQNVKFEYDATPGNFPEGQNISFIESSEYDANNPSPKWGINEGENLGIVFNYINGSDYSKVVDGLNSGLFRVGLHVQALPVNDGSESFVNTVKVPEPGTLSLLAIGLFGLLGSGFTTIRRKK
jgi:hypothetical protein